MVKEEKIYVKKMTNNYNIMGTSVTKVVPETCVPYLLCRMNKREKNRFHERCIGNKNVFFAVLRNLPSACSAEINRYGASNPRTKDHSHKERENIVESSFLNDGLKSLLFRKLSIRTT